MLPLLARDAVVAGTSAVAILAVGMGAAAGILLGGGPVGAVTLAAVAWLTAVAVPVTCRYVALRGPATIDPFSLREPWRHAVQEALKAQARFRQATTDIAPGPLRERLSAIGAQLDRGVAEAGQVARRGQRLEDVRRQIDAGGILAQLEQVEQNADAAWASGSSLERTAEALRSQLATAERLDQVLAQTRERLTLLDARMDEAVARSLELSVRTDDPAQLGGIGTAVEEVVEEMEALRLALDEADGGPTTPPS